jgi:cell division septal protein FtsQ
LSNKSKTSKINRLKKKKRKLFLINLLLSISKISIFFSSLYIIYLLWINPFWNLKIIEINNISENTQSFIRKLNLEKVYLEKNILFINPILLKEELISNKRIFKDIIIERSLFPAKLKIEVFERKPYLNIKIKNKNEVYTIDNEGVVLIKKYIKKTYFVIDKIVNYQITKEQLKVLKKIYFYITNNKIPEEIGLFDITNPNDIHLYTKDNHIILGNIENFILKIKSIPQLEEIAKNNKEKLKYIDIKSYDKPFFKIEKN